MQRASFCSRVGLCVLQWIRENRGGRIERRWKWLTSIRMPRLRKLNCQFFISIAAAETIVNGATLHYQLLGATRKLSYRTQFPVHMLLQRSLWPIRILLGERGDSAARGVGIGRTKRTRRQLWEQGHRHRLYECWLNVGSVELWMEMKRPAAFRASSVHDAAGSKQWVLWSVLLLYMRLCI